MKCQRPVTWTAKQTNKLVVVLIYWITQFNWRTCSFSSAHCAVAVHLVQCTMTVVQLVMKTIKRHHHHHKFASLRAVFEWMFISIWNGDLARQAASGQINHFWTYKCSSSQWMACVCAVLQSAPAACASMMQDSTALVGPLQRLDRAIVGDAAGFHCIHTKNNNNNNSIQSNEMFNQSVSV